MVVGGTTPSSIYDNARQCTMSTQRSNSRFDITYMYHMRVNDRVTAILYMGDGNETNQVTEGTMLESSEAPVTNEGIQTVVNSITPIDDEDQICYCDRALDIISHPYAGSCRRSFHICCVPNAEFNNDW